MERAKTTPINEERTFTLDELFFSTTDAKGIIQSGNNVFARVSGYDDVQNLVDKPHNIIRHPDMPRAVFKLMWDHLKEQKPFAGYVKNMAKDGRYYWVMALVVPIREGFLSIRFKPSSQYLKAAGDLYGELLAVEKSAGNGPESWREGMALAVQRLSAWLKENGFADYDAFMHTVLATEMSSRRENLRRSGSANTNINHKATLALGQSKQSDVVDSLRLCLEIEHQLDDLFSEAVSFIDLVSKFDNKSSFLVDMTDDVHLISLNGVISSNRLGAEACGLSVVTQNLASIADESAKIVTLMTDQNALTLPLRETAFAITAAKLQVEMAIFFARELIMAEVNDSLATQTPNRIRADVRTLIESFSTSTARLIKTLPKAQTSVSQRVAYNSQLTTVFRKLSRVHVTGKVQAAHVKGADNFQEYFEKIYELLQQASVELRELTIAAPYLAAHLPKFEYTGRSVQSSLSSFS